MTTKDWLSVVVPADEMPGPEQGHWTYEEYAAIVADGRRYEVVDGVLYMTPSPSVGHQEVTGQIYACLLSFVQAAGVGKVYIAPLDVELSYGNVVQPDVFVLLNEHLDRIMHSRIIGAPDLVVEVASPGTVRHDLYKKQDAYAHAAVPEYWVVNPDARTIELLVLEGSSYGSLGLFKGKTILPSQILPDFAVPVERFFSGTSMRY